MQTPFSGRVAPLNTEWVTPIVPQTEPEFHRPNYNTPNDTTATAVSFGFIATAILISIFLVIAIFERLFRQRPPLASVNSQQNSQLEPSISPERTLPNQKTDRQRSEIDCTKGVSVLMPGQDVPTFIAHPVPYSGSLESQQNSHERDFSSGIELASCHLDLKAENSGNELNNRQ